MGYVELLELLMSMNEKSHLGLIWDESGPTIDVRGNTWRYYQSPKRTDQQLPLLEEDSSISSAENPREPAWVSERSIKVYS